jgi:hypothetical protein
MSAESKPSIVICHGIGADGSCFSKVIPALPAEGHGAIAAQYALDTPEEDVATVIRSLNRVDARAMSHPDVVIDVIRTAANAVQGSPAAASV